MWGMAGELKVHCRFNGKESEDEDSDWRIVSKKSTPKMLQRGVPIDPPKFLVDKTTSSSSSEIRPKQEDVLDIQDLIGSPIVCRSSDSTFQVYANQTGVRENKRSQHGIEWNILPFKLSNRNKKSIEDEVLIRDLHENWPSVTSVDHSIAEQPDNSKKWSDAVKKPAKQEKPVKYM